MTTIKYLSLSKPERFLVKFGDFFRNLGKGFVGFFKRLPSKFMKFGNKIAAPFDVLIEAFRKGNWMSRTNFLVFGFYQLTHHEVFRGALYLLYEVVFILYMITTGGPYLGKLGNLGSFSTDSEFLLDPFEGTTSPIIGGDKSFTVLLYSIITFILIIICVVLWFYSIRDAKSLLDNNYVGRFSKNGQVFDDLLNKDYHTLLLAIPIVGLVAFTVIPVVFMIIASFTNYSSIQINLFDWVEFDNYAILFSGSGSGSGGGLGTIFLKVLAWTLMWALIATFTNYFLGMVVALLINKKGIKLKKLWRTVLILTIAVPQFVSLMLINQMLADNGFLTEIFRTFGWVTANKGTFDSTILTRIIIIVVNMWVGVPYTMLISSGILMNIPEDLYESARIDGASAFKMFMSITLPYMLFITGPYLLSQFIGNINNFNIIYLLSQGKPTMNLSGLGYGDVGETDLLITWIYKMSMEGQTKNYAVACALGVLVFAIIAIFSLVFYGNSASVKNEEDFQ